ncbi:MAG: PilN domain-containing protein [Candidatus Omnitrophica bacterium]|nr:PilN domain-containing protein [Candidatus Omnitrophota bacterium]
MIKFSLKIPALSRAAKKLYTGLEIEDGYIKLAQAEEFAGLRKITRLIIKKTASSSEQDITVALKDVLRELNGPLGHLTLCLPRHKVTVRFLSFPTSSHQELAGMVRLQSVKELPFAKEELINDYLITEQSKDGYSKVALVIAHRDLINNYLNILQKSALEPTRITLSTEAILDWYAAVFKQGKPSGCSLLVDLDTDNADIAILANGRLSFTRGLKLSTLKMSESNLKDKLAQELNLTITGYARENPAQKIEQILLSQSVDNAADLQSFLAQKFKLPCELLNTFKNLNLRPGLAQTKYQPQISLLKVLGAVLSRREKQLNLLPETLSKKQQVTSNKKLVYTTAILLTGILLFSIGIFGKKMHNQKIHLADLEREIANTQGLAKQVEDMLKSVQLIARRSRLEGSSIDVLRELHALVPEDISLANFSYDEGSKIIGLRGISTEMSAIFRFIEQLEGSSYFKNVQLKYVSEKKAKTAGLTDFKIECSLEK